MEIVGVTRLKDGEEVDEFVVGCPEHGYWFKGSPPLTHGCQECWHAYYFAQFAMAGAKPEQVDQLEAALHHAAEMIDKGEFDFVPELSDFEIEHDA